MHEPAKSVGIPTIFLEDSLPPSLSTPAVIFLGMNPGADEDEQGIPFVGESGQRLRQVYIDGLSIKERASVYLTNTIRCGPSPKFPKRCIQACFPYTAMDISRIIPTANRTAVVCCGSVATEAFFNWLLPPVEQRTKRGVRLVQRKVSQTEGFSLSGESYTIPGTDLSLTHFSVYHPAALGYNPRLKDVLPDQLELLNKWLSGISTAVPAPLLIAPTSPQDFDW